MNEYGLLLFLTLNFRHENKRYFQKGFYQPEHNRRRRIGFESGEQPAGASGGGVLA
jgi:hypothetical protein